MICRIATTKSGLRPTRSRSSCSASVRRRRRATALRSIDVGAAFSAIRHLRHVLAPRLLWGRRNQRARAALKDTNLTQFAPDIFAGLYLSLFMFNGEHTLEYVE